MVLRLVDEDFRPAIVLDDAKAIDLDNILMDRSSNDKKIVLKNVEGFKEW